MSDAILGQVRDKITSISRTGQSGLVDTYTIYTECSPTGAGTFQVTNGKDGQDGQDGSPRKVATGVSSFACQYGVAYLIKIIGDSAYVPIEGTNYYGSFFFTNYSYSTVASDAGIAGPIGLHKKLLFLGKQVSTTPETMGLVSPYIVEEAYTLTPTNGTLDVYVLD